jgi:hypothetical protein
MATPASRRQDKSSSDETADSGYYTACMSLGSDPQSGSQYTDFKQASDGSQSIEAWFAAKDPYRVVAVGHPRSFLIAGGPCSNDVAEVWEQHVRPRTRAILDKHNIRWMSLGVRRAWLSGQDGKNQLLNTVMIETISEDSTSWRGAAREIFSIFQEHELSEDRIEVEIVNPPLAWSTISVRLDDDKAVLDLLHEIKPTIIQTVKSELGPLWTSIAFHGRRPKGDWQAPVIPTIVVFVRENSTANFSRLEERLSLILESLKPAIALEILLGSISNGYLDKGQSYIYRNCQPDGLHNGASIGVQDNTTEAGTLGPFVYLNVGYRRLKCAMTCHHVTLSTDPLVKFHTNEQGVSFDQNNELGKVEVRYPALYDLNATILHLEKIAPLHGTDKDLLDQMHKMASERPFGKVIASSGVKIRNNRRLDWSLIEISQITNKLMRNKPVPRSLLDDMDYPPSGPYNITEDTWIKQWQLEPSKPQDWLVKFGRSSRCTTGLINSMNRIVQWLSHPGLETEEIEIMGLTSDFAALGDSGSMITNTKGELVGMLIGKDGNAGDWGFGFMTHFSAIREHVREVTGGFLSLN